MDLTLGKKGYLSKTGTWPMCVPQINKDAITWRQGPISLHQMGGPESIRIHTGTLWPGDGRGDEGQWPEEIFERRVSHSYFGAQGSSFTLVQGGVQSGAARFLSDRMRLHPGIKLPTSASSALTMSIYNRWRPPSKTV